VGGGLIDVRRSEEFTRWLDGLRDRAAKSRIESRLVRVQEGNLGDVRSVGGRVSEMRIDYGPGYRLYFVRQGRALVILLCGGDKGRQERDILHAKALAASLRTLP